jgi:GDPmannose 4,6-dehydratase
MLQQETPEDFVIATGQQRTVREFIEVAAAEFQMPLHWEGEGVNERGFDDAGNCIVSVDERYFRPTEVDSLLGDAGKAREKLGWKPRTSFSQLVAEMVRQDLFEVQQQYPRRSSHATALTANEWPPDRKWAHLQRLEKPLSDQSSFPANEVAAYPWGRT